jgi:hypothetical protein
MLNFCLAICLEVAPLFIAHVNRLIFASQLAAHKHRFLADCGVKTEAIMFFGAIKKEVGGN